MNALILLTAAVTPDAAFLASNASFRMTLDDPQVRAGQYRAAVDHWHRVAQVVRRSGGRGGDLGRRPR